MSTFLALMFCALLCLTPIICLVDWIFKVDISTIHIYTMVITLILFAIVSAKDDVNFPA